MNKVHQDKKRAHLLPLFEIVMSRFIVFFSSALTVRTGKLTQNGTAFMSHRGKVRRKVKIANECFFFCALRQDPIDRSETYRIQIFQAYYLPHWLVLLLRPGCRSTVSRQSKDKAVPYRLRGWGMDNKISRFLPQCCCWIAVYKIKISFGDLSLSLPLAQEAGNFSGPVAL